jgi:nicotinamidase-related amidase
MDKSKLLFVDVNTQKCFVEHFGEKAVPDCPGIRENLMELTYIGPKNGIRIASLVFDGTEFCIPGSNDHMKVSDSVNGENEQIIFNHKDLENFECNDLADFINENAIKSVFVYGVPLEGSVLQVCEWLLGKVNKVWLVRDCVKAYDGEEDKYYDILREKGVKMVDTRNLESYINH